MKIISKKTWLSMEDQKNRLTKQILTQQHELAMLRDQLAKMSNDVLFYSTQIEDKTKEIKKLKTLLTKNKIVYKKENK